METLDYAEMGALARMFTRWALSEPSLDGNQRTKLIELSLDYERIAAYCGDAWTATNPEYPPDALVFTARLELRDAREAECGEDEARWRERLKKIAKQQPERPE